MEATVIEVERNLQDSRKNQNRPEDPFVMSQAELILEKSTMQKQLLMLEKRHGRPDTKEEKDVVRSLYDRYRIVKRISCRATTVKENSLDLAPILEHETLQLNVETEAETSTKTPTGCSVVEVKKGNVASPKSRRRRLGVTAAEDQLDETCNNLQNEDFNDMNL
jgi:hypothetical protein